MVPKAPVVDDGDGAAVNAKLGKCAVGSRVFVEGSSISCLKNTYLELPDLREAIRKCVYVSRMITSKTHQGPNAFINQHLKHVVPMAVPTPKSL